MIWPLLASGLGLVDTVTSVALQRNGFIESGLPAWMFGHHPSPGQFALGYVVITLVLWGLYYGVGWWVVVPWLVVETYEVARNVWFLVT